MHLIIYGSLQLLCPIGCCVIVFDVVTELGTWLLLLVLNLIVVRNSLKKLNNCLIFEGRAFV